MADIADRADEQNEMMQAAQIEAARTTTAYLPGPSRCVKCGYPNDRRELGYAVCSDCLEVVPCE